MYLKAFRSSISELYHQFKYFISINIKYLIKLIDISIPYIYAYISILLYKERNNLIIGYEVLIPIIAYIILSVLNNFLNKINKGYDIPLPRERFTTLNDNGNVSVDNSSINDIILYLYDLEEYLKSKGYTIE